MKRLKLILIIVAISFCFQIYVSAKSQYKLPILLYHHILKDEENHNYRNGSTMTPETFEEQMSFLFNEGYETITTDELQQFLKGKLEITGKKVLITFDDGYLSNRIYAYDILKKYNFTAAVFIITGMMPEEQQTFNPDVLNIFSAEDMEMTKDVFEFGSHTHDLHRKDDRRIPYILCKPKDQVLADISKSYFVSGIKKIFAYPYGEYNSNTVKLLQTLDTEMAFTVSDKYVTKTSKPYSLPRFTIKSDISIERFKEIFTGLN